MCTLHIHAWMISICSAVAQGVKLFLALMHLASDSVVGASCLSGSETFSVLTQLK